MQTETGVAAIAHVIQLSVAPVFLLSGVSAMLGVLTNRVSRIIDRARTLEMRLESVAADHAAALRTELIILERRARLVSHAISLCTMCALLICAVVIGLFLGAFFGRDVSNAIGVLFIAALSALAAGLVTFLREIYLALRNLRIGPLV